MFEKASRLKIRFDSPKGALSVEDLWDLPLTSNTGKANLDDIAKVLHAELKRDDGVSFVTKTNPAKVIPQLKFDIVLHIIEVRVAENDAAAARQANREKKQKLMELIERKQDAALEGKSIEELRALMESL